MEMFIWMLSIDKWTLMWWCEKERKEGNYDIYVGIISAFLWKHRHLVHRSKVWEKDRAEWYWQRSSLGAAFVLTIVFTRLLEQKWPKMSNNEPFWIQCPNNRKSQIINGSLLIIRAWGTLERFCWTFASK